MKVVLDESGFVMKSDRFIPIWMKAYLTDSHVVIPCPNKTTTIHAALQDAMFSTTGIRINPRKTKVWNAAGFKQSGCGVLQRIAETYDPTAVVWRGSELPTQNGDEEHWTPMFLGQDPPSGRHASFLVVVGPLCSCTNQLHDASGGTWCNAGFQREEGRTVVTVSVPDHADLTNPGRRHPTHSQFVCGTRRVWGALTGPVGPSGGNNTGGTVEREPRGGVQGGFQGGVCREGFSGEGGWGEEGGRFQGFFFLVGFEGEGREGGGGGVFWREEKGRGGLGGFG